MWSINEDRKRKRKIYITFHISYKDYTYQIIKDPCNGKQYQHNITSYGETAYITQNMIHDYSKR